MALKGDTRALGLADIFQALAMSKREGVLSVASGGKEIKLHFSTGGVRLLSTGALRHTRLGSILLEMDDFAPKNLEFALQLQKQTGKKLGEVLVEYGLLAQEQIEHCLRRQIEEEITELFLWDNAEFHFEPGLPQEEYFDPTGEGRVFELNVSRMLVEAARNVDEWSVLLLDVQNSGHRYVYKNGYPVMPDTSPFGIPLVTGGEAEPRHQCKLRPTLGLSGRYARELEPLRQADYMSFAGFVRRCEHPGSIAQPTRQLGQSLLAG